MIRYVCPDALEDGYQFSKDPTYCQPPEGKHADYLAYLRSTTLLLTRRVTLRGWGRRGDEREG